MNSIVFGVGTYIFKVRGLRVVRGRFTTLLMINETLKNRNIPNDVA